ncbi:uncharacterized protein NFIA_070990 [Aspergillus fischeri NRRL 181]|uniref:Tim44-like domain-containing protein n=1 Tax=Neosartorya fischeri (strain ATCC 1020 / DSM 3700 / CBS 544.65 / FGSC A1164 / JCM 1740 / NRRL 181 / WB 181) TaxID=331117 RepID=A1D884_NEOFI|nr:conserved hypothetical protein [Aspergillus fischeri NRRL 181]EAW21928.1 conserved hypothetical protein [Aspergillus fischeri NRRL 181]KAG2007857.1 hypothetical protein GB937_008217 [Aspergillus fischeri]
MASSLWRSPNSLRMVVRPGTPIAEFYQSATSPSSAVVAYCQCRLFSQSQMAQRGLSGIPQNISVKQPAQPSMRTRGRELSRSELPQDIGLLPGTFIRPLWKDMPSIFQQPKERLQLEWLWLKNAVQNFLGLIAYSKWINKGLPLRLKERRQVARELHQRMYSAFADGDVNTLRKICCSGLANNLSSRVASRPKDEKVTWALDKYNRTPGTLFTGLRVLADRATQIPDLPDSGVRQVVVRITSRQSTSKVTIPTKRGAESAVAAEPAPAKQQDCTEYIVIQKLRWTGEEQEWRIWGHATPTTVEDLDSPFFAPGLTLSERMDAMKDMMTGKK